MTHRFGLTNTFQMNVTLCRRLSTRPWKKCVCGHFLTKKELLKQPSSAKTGLLEVGHIHIKKKTVPRMTAFTQK